MYQHWINIKRWSLAFSHVHMFNQQKRISAHNFLLSLEKKGWRHIPLPTFLQHDVYLSLQRRSQFSQQNSQHHRQSAHRNTKWIGWIQSEIKQAQELKRTYKPVTVVGNYPLRCGGRMLWSLPIPHCECGDDLVEAPAVEATAEAESYVKTGIWVAVTTLLLRETSLKRRGCDKTPSIHSSQTPLRHSCVHTSFLSNSFLSFPLLGILASITPTPSPDCG